MNATLNSLGRCLKIIDTFRSAVTPLLDDENDTVRNVAAAAVIRLSAMHKK